jgi:glycosyltransferase involved in cell wall biosynthesis
MINSDKSMRTGLKGQSSNETDIQHSDAELSTGKPDLSVVYIGNFARPTEKQILGLKNYSRFFNELAADSRLKQVNVFGGYILPGETGYEFVNDTAIDDRIQFTLSKGNTPTTGIMSFFWNNFKLFTRLISFSSAKRHYFIFLPAPFGVFTLMIQSVFKRRKSLGMYIGGYYGREQAYEARKGFLKRKIKSKVAGLVDKWVEKGINTADYVITSSYEYYESYKHTGRIFLTPPLINVTEDDLLPWKGDKKEKTISFCGELRSPKGIFDLVNAFVLLVETKRIHNVALRIIGDGQAADELKAIVKAKKLEQMILFEGQVKSLEKLKQCIADSTVFVLPSYSEGFPRVAYESFTLGVPAILTPVGGIPYFVSDQEHCLFVEPGNVNDLADKIEYLLNNEALQKALAENAAALMKSEVFPRIKKERSLAQMVISKMTGGRG